MFLSCRGGKYSEDDAKTEMIQILKVVAFCHLQGVVHRDLKPEVGGLKFSLYDCFRTNNISAYLDILPCVEGRNFFCTKKRLFLYWVLDYVNIPTAINFLSVSSCVDILFIRQT